MNRLVYFPYSNYYFSTDFSGKSNNNLDTWALLARTLLSSVAEGAVLGTFLARFSLSESSLASLLSLDNTLKPAWLNIVEQSKGVEVSS